MDINRFLIIFIKKMKRKVSENIFSETFFENFVFSNIKHFECYRMCDICATLRFLIFFSFVVVVVITFFISKIVTFFLISFLFLFLLHFIRWKWFSSLLCFLDIVHHHHRNIQSRNLSTVKFFFIHSKKKKFWFGHSSNQ